MNMLKTFSVFVAFGTFAVECTAQTVNPKDATNFVGKLVTVCGRVASTKYLPNSKTKITLLNLDAPFPNHIFTAVIYGGDRPKFSEPEIKCSNKQVCVTGQVSIFRETPQIVLKDPSQLKGC